MKGDRQAEPARLIALSRGSSTLGSQGSILIRSLAWERSGSPKIKMAGEWTNFAASADKVPSH